MSREQKMDMDSGKSVDHHHLTPIKSIGGWVIFITGIHEDCTEEDLQDKFADYGHIKQVKLALDHRSGYPKGYGTVEFEEWEAASEAVRLVDGEQWNGQRLKVNFAFIE